MAVLAAVIVLVAGMLAVSVGASPSQPTVTKVTIENCQYSTGTIWHTENIVNSTFDNTIHTAFFGDWDNSATDDNVSSGLGSTENIIYASKPSDNTGVFDNVEWSLTVSFNENLENAILYWSWWFEDNVNLDTCYLYSILENTSGDNIQLSGTLSLTEKQDAWHSYTHDITDNITVAGDNYKIKFKTEIKDNVSASPNIIVWFDNIRLRTKYKGSSDNITLGAINFGYTENSITSEGTLNLFVEENFTATADADVSIAFEFDPVAAGITWDNVWAGGLSREKYLADVTDSDPYGVSWSPHDPNLIAAVGNYSDTIEVFSYDNSTKSLVRENYLVDVTAINDPYGVSWSPHDPNLIAAIGSTSNTIAVFSYDNSTKSLVRENYLVDVTAINAPYGVSWSPHDPKLIAVTGLSNDTIAVFSYDNSTKSLVRENYLVDVTAIDTPQGVSWSPHDPNLIAATAYYSDTIAVFSTTPRIPSHTETNENAEWTFSATVNQREIELIYYIPFQIENWATVQTSSEHNIDVDDNVTYKASVDVSAPFSLENLAIVVSIPDPTTLAGVDNVVIAGAAISKSVTGENVSFTIDEVSTDNSFSIYYAENAAYSTPTGLTIADSVWTYGWNLTNPTASHTYENCKFSVTLSELWYRVSGTEIVTWAGSTLASSQYSISDTTLSVDPSLSPGTSAFSVRFTHATVFPLITPPKLREFSVAFMPGALIEMEFGSKTMFTLDENILLRVHVEDAATGESIIGADIVMWYNAPVMHTVPTVDLGDGVYEGSIPASDVGVGTFQAGVDVQMEGFNKASSTLTFTIAEELALPLWESPILWAGISGLVVLVLVALWLKGWWLG